MIKSQNTKPINLTQTILEDSEEFWIHRPQILIQFQLEDELLVVNRNRLIQKTLFLGGHYIKYAEDRFLDIRNLLLELIYHPKSSQTGFRLTRNGEKLDVYGDIQNWVDYLKKFTIQQHLQQKYKIMKKIGEGSIFQVFKIRHKVTGFQYAVKIYDKIKIVNSPFLLEVVKKQIKMMREINHPNLIQLYEIFESSNHLYIVQELVEGGNLEDKIKQTKLNQQQIIFIIKQTLSALQELHKSGMIHGDVTLKSIYFRNEQELSSLCLLHYSKLISINVARRQSMKRRFSQRASLKVDKSHISDMQQLGIILIALLTGHQFNQYNLPNQIDDIKSILNFQNISNELEIILQQLLMIDFEAQITSDTNTPLEVLKNDIFQKQIEPQNFLLKYQAIKEQKIRQKESEDEEDEMLEVRSRVNTLPNVSDRSSSSRQISQRVEKQLTPLKASLFKTRNSFKSPSQKSDRIQSNLYQLPRLNIMPKINKKYK